MKTINKKFYIIASFVLVLFIGILIFFLFSLSKKPPKVNGADEKITLNVQTVTTVSIYVTGEKVTKLETDANSTIEKYEVSVGSSFTLTCVNESRMFESWVILDDDNASATGNGATDRRITLTASKNLNISTTRTDPTVNDLGKYMDNPFIISSEDHVLLLENIVDFEEGVNNVNYFQVITAYNHFFKSDPEYKKNVIDSDITGLNPTNDEKITYIKNNGYFERLRKGYIKIQESFTILNESFTGIGSKQYPFEGVMCGLNNTNTSNAQIFSSLDLPESSGKDVYAGLFQSLNENAVIRNLNVKTSIGIEKNNLATNTNANIYAGGIAGEVDNALLINLKISTIINIDTSNKNVYAGGVAGIFTGGIDDISNVNLDLTSSTWVISSGANTSSYAGGVCGKATDVYLKRININVSNFAANLKNISSNVYSSNTNNYLGNLFGYYENNTAKALDNILISGTKREYLHSIVSSGNSYVGGLIGYVKTNASLEVGSVAFNITTTDKTRIISESLDENSKANIYAAGVFAVVDGATLKANDSFKTGIIVNNVDGKKVNEYKYLFNTSMEILAKQQGVQDTDNTYGSTISAGLVGDGYFNISGTADERSNIILTPNKYNLTINAIQSSMTNHPETKYLDYVSSGKLTNNPKHCLASMVFGYLDDSYTTESLQNINIYGNNVRVDATREIGSRSLGDVSAAGFLCYASGKDFNNISIYLGDNSSIKANSLSYEVGYKGNSNLTSSNNNYVSAFISNLISSSSKNNVINNIKVTGFDFDSGDEVGTTIQIQGIQNSKGISGTNTCLDYTNENYVGGVIGCASGRFEMSDISFIGNQNNKSQIIMQGHRDPNSAFSGGIVGFSKLLLNSSNNGYTQTYNNCVITHANVIGNATISEDASYKNPDIYVGGIIGACYADGYAGTLNINSSVIYNSVIEGIGNERIEVYVGGALGTMTWKGTLKINDVYIINSLINSELNATSAISSDTGTHLGARSGGILGTYTGSTPEINNSVVIACLIEAKCSDNFINGKTYSTAGAFFGDYNKGFTINNCYTNSTVQSFYGDSDKANQYNYGNLSNCYASYYVDGVNDFTDSAGIALDFSNKDFTYNETKTILGFTSASNANTSSKYFVNILSREVFSTNWNLSTNPEVTVTSKLSNATSEAEIWINAKSSGGDKGPNDYASNEERIKAGWFNLGNLYLICGTSTGEVILEEGSFSRSYLVDDVEYIFDKTLDDSRLQFITKKSPTKYLYDIGYVEYATDTVDYKRDGQQTLTLIRSTTDVLINSTIPSIKINFTIKNKVDTKGVLPPIYYLSWLKQTNPTETSSGVEKIQMNDSSIVGYGSYTYTYEVIKYGENNEFEKINYELIFTPNKELAEDTVLYVGFYMGSGVNNSDEVYADYCLRFNIYANTYNLVGGSLALYTPAMNDSESDETLGQSENNPYHFQTNTSYRIIPVLSRKYEQNEKIISEIHAQDVTYVINSQVAGSIRSNGELTTSSNASNTVYKVTITLKADPTISKDVYFIIVSKYNVSYTSDGSNLDGLPFSTSSADYYLNIDVLSHCGGIPDKFEIVINNVTYNLIDNGEINSSYKWIYSLNGTTPLDSWNNNFSFYQLRIPSEYITGDIKIEISFPVNFTIEFHIQTDMFNPNFGLNNDLVLSVKVKAGTTFGELFNSIVLNPLNEAHKNKTYKEVLDEWADLAEIDSFGYLFTGFFLIDDSSSVASYGQSFEEILKKNLKINTSYVFYARWSFLIELVEAPGTHIVTSFSQDFMYEVDITNANGKYDDLLRKNISIPINNNRGYVFTIVKDDNFIGEADVEAYIITGSRENHIISQITIEKYHENMYLYFIPPEVIKGYLVITTKVSNSDIIVGEDTASVTKDIIPLDGIYTFKYIVNHKKDATGKQSSYIYNDGILEGTNTVINNLELNREILLKFYEETYDLTTRKTKIIERNLINGTIIEVYYKKYINGSTTEDQIILGKYKVVDDVTKEVRLTDFTNFNGEDKAFETIKFSELLGNYDSLSEVYYFVIIPPNGTNTYLNSDDSYNPITGLYGNYVNNYLYVGYYDDLHNQYVNGKRTDNEFINIPIDDILEENLQYESACQIKSYTITPSRVTKLTQDESETNLFHFIDDDSFNIFDVYVQNGRLSEANRLIFNSGTVDNTILISSEIKMGINQLRLTLGFNKGTIRVLGSTDGENFDIIEEVEVLKETYLEYIVEFDIEKNYKYFKIEKLTDLELRLDKIGLVVIENAMLYEMKFESSHFEDIYLPNYTVSDISLPQFDGLTWELNGKYDEAELSQDGSTLIVKPGNEEATIELIATYLVDSNLMTRRFEIIIPDRNPDLKAEDVYLPAYVTGDITLPELEGYSWSVTSSTYAKLDTDGITLKVTRPTSNRITSTTVTLTLTDNSTNENENFQITIIGTRFNQNSNIFNNFETIYTGIKHSFNLPMLNNLSWNLDSVTINNNKITDTEEIKKYVSMTNNFVEINRTTFDYDINFTAKLNNNSRQFKYTVKALPKKIDINQLGIPEVAESTLILPTADYLEWSVISGDATINNNILVLNGESSNVKIKATYFGEEKEYVVFMQKNSDTYTLRKKIIGDTRHENKHFIMAVQFTDTSGEFIENIQSVTISINGTVYNPIIDNVDNRNVVYFDLSEILNKLGGKTLDIVINYSDDYMLYAVELLECTLQFKPAMGEIRDLIKLK